MSFINQSFFDKYKFVLFFIFLNFFVSTTNVFAQDLLWDASLHNFFDNREYYNEYGNSGTYFGSRLALSGGYAIDSNHSFMAGINYFYEFGDPNPKFNPKPIVYYKYKDNKNTFYIGAFARRKLLRYPNSIISDTILYFRPNIEGFFVERKFNFGHQNFWMDWTGLQTPTNNESFMAGISGMFWFADKKIFVKDYTYLHHYANTSVYDSTKHIRDNMGFQVTGGIDLTPYLFLDTLTFEGGILASYNRLKKVYDWRQKYGFTAMLDARYKFMGISALCYFGEQQSFLSGDKIYMANYYSRVDLTVSPFRKIRQVDFSILFSMHFVETSIDYSQQIQVFVKIGGARKIYKQPVL